MSSQFVDLNADGHNDILAGSFSGTPQIVMGGGDGFAEPKEIRDSDDELVLISQFWNSDENKWDDTDRSAPDGVDDADGLCTSSSAVDWDNDGDLDLVLGAYYNGSLFLRLNEGTKTEPAFASVNQQILAGGKPLKVEKGMAAPCIVDWNGDGLFDILCGGSKGGVFYFENKGTKGSPKFAASHSLIAPLDDPSNSFMKRVPSENGQPVMPGSSYHIEAVDYDHDGDLDLLVGGRSSWDSGERKEISDDEKNRLKEIQTELDELNEKVSTLLKGATEQADREKLFKSEEFLAFMKQSQALRVEQSKLDFDPIKSGGFVWFFERKSTQEEVEVTAK